MSSVFMNGSPPLRGLPFGGAEVCKMCVLSRRNGASNREAPFRLDETHMSTTCVKRVLAHAFRLGEMLKNTCVGVKPTTIARTSQNFLNVFLQISHGPVFCQILCFWQMCDFPAYLCTMGLVLPTAGECICGQITAFFVKFWCFWIFPIGRSGRFFVKFGAF